MSGAQQKSFKSDNNVSRSLENLQEHFDFLWPVPTMLPSLFLFLYMLKTLFKGKLPPTCTYCLCLSFLLLLLLTYLCCIIVSDASSFARYLNFYNFVPSPCRPLLMFQPAKKAAAMLSSRHIQNTCSWHPSLLV